MVKQHAAKPPGSKSVFINCPFDDGFRPILRAVAFTVISSAAGVPRFNVPMELGLHLGARLFGLTHSDFLFVVRDWITTRAQA